MNELDEQIRKMRIRWYMVDGIGLGIMVYLAYQYIWPIIDLSLEAKMSDFDPAGMDEVAEKAAKELKKDWTAKQFLMWIKKYYLTAGYKRLIRKAFLVYLKD